MLVLSMSLFVIIQQDCDRIQLRGDLNSARVLFAPAEVRSPGLCGDHNLWDGGSTVRHDGDSGPGPHFLQGRGHGFRRG